MSQDGLADPTIADKFDEGLLDPLSDEQAGSDGSMINLLYSDSRNDGL